MRVLLVGCVQSSALFLEKLININADIVGVITKKDSKFNADFVDLGVICKEHKIDCFYVEHINSQEAKDYIASKNVDLLLGLGWSQLLDKEVMELPRLGCIGFHPADLPNNRGRHPLIWALALGLSRTASTLFLMDEGADTGKIVSQQYVEIEYQDDASTLYQKIMKVATSQLEEVIKDFEANSIVARKQSTKEGNSWRKRGRADGEIDWRMSSKGIYNLVRALTKPYVGAHFMYKGIEYKVWKVRERFDSGYENIEPGKVIQVISDNHLIVKAGDNLIEILDCDTIDITRDEYL